MRVAIYIRVSTLDQAREGYSLAAQEHTLRRWCGSNGHQVIGVYADEGISAKDIRHRPAMQQLLADAANRQFEMVLVWALSRFTRSVADLYHSLSVLDTQHIQLRSHTEPFDTGSVFGRAMLGILGVFAQLERELTAERVRAAMAERARQGKRTCSYVLGYDVILGGGMQVNPDEAKNVRLIYAEYLRTRNLSAVAQLCTEKGILGKRGRPLVPESVHKILTRYLYCGYYSYKGAPIPADFEPIIDVDTFNRVQDTIENRGDRWGRNRKAPLIRLEEK